MKPTKRQPQKIDPDKMTVQQKYEYLADMGYSEEELDSVPKSELVFLVKDMMGVLE